MKRTYELRIVVEMPHDDYWEFYYEPSENDLNEAMAETYCECYFENVNDANREVVIAGLKSLIESEEEIKSAMFKDRTIREKLSEIFYDEARTAYFD